MNVMNELAVIYVKNYYGSRVGLASLLMFSWA